MTVCSHSKVVVYLSKGLTEVYGTFTLITTTSFLGRMGNGSLVVRGMHPQKKNVPQSIIMLYLSMTQDKRGLRGEKLTAKSINSMFAKITGI